MYKYKSIYIHDPLQHSVEYWSIFSVYLKLNKSITGTDMAPLYLLYYLILSWIK